MSDETSETAALRRELDKLRADFEASRRLIYSAGPRLGKVERDMGQLQRKVVAVEGRTKSLAFSEATKSAAHSAAIAVVRDHPTAGEHPVDWEGATATISVDQLAAAFLEFGRTILLGEAP